MRETALRLATEEDNKRKTDPNETHERSIIILGSKGVVSDETKSVSRSRRLHFELPIAFLG